jgi:tetratricopeptide (TPR) repeat protein
MTPVSVSARRGVRRVLCVACVWVFGLAGAQGVRAQDGLSVAHHYYGAAQYERALEVLAAAADAGADQADADRLRALCLLALGRTAEADDAIARAVAARPAAGPPSDASPRVRRAFHAVRDRVLPALAEERYDAARAAFDRRAFVEAASLFDQALPVLEVLALEGRRDMESRRVLATDFALLSRQLAAQASRQ